MVIDREAFGRDWRVGDVTTQPFQFAALVILRASNSGKGHVRLNSASLMGPNGQFLEKRGMAEFILPGGVRTWEFAPEAAAGPWQLIADTNEGPIRVSLELGPDQSTATAADVGQ